MRGRPIRVTRVSGSPAQLGEAHGRAHAEEIRTYADGRIALSGTGTDLDRDRLIGLAEQMVDAHRDYDAGLFEEMSALAEAAGLTLPEAIIVGGYTDFLDVVAAAAGSAPFEDDCTAVIAPDARSNGAGFLAQTWDMNASATPHVIMLDVIPDTGPRALVFTTVGTLGQIGMNEAGIAVGINNLTAADGRPGVTWPFVVRKALAQSRFDDAVAAITDAHLAGGHNFLVFDRHGNGVSIEAMPTRTHVDRLAVTPLFHTNHCLVPETIAVEGPRPDDLVRSSVIRISQAAEMLGSGPITVESLMELTRDERSICRHPEPPFDFESCGAAIMRPATGDFWACWGIPSENEYEHFSLTTSSVT
jgi:isopenicillin-N N-acyltransferase-like protein